MIVHHRGSRENVFAKIAEFSLKPMMLCCAGKIYTPIQPAACSPTEFREKTGPMFMDIPVLCRTAKALRQWLLDKSQ